MKRILTKLSITIVTLFSAALLFTSCAEMFQQKVTTKYSDFSLSDIVRSSVVKDQLETPQEIWASKAESADSISVQWAEVEGARSYCLERAIVDPTNPEVQIPPDDSEFSIVKRYVYGTTFTDTSIFGNSTPNFNSPQYVNGYRYYYRVTAENGLSGIEPSSPTSNEVYGTLFAPPMVVNATAGESESGIEISWSRVTNAHHYEVYRTKNPDYTGMECIKSDVTANNLSWINSINSDSDKGVDFFYTVKAVNASGNSTVQGPVQLGYALKAGAPSKVAGIVVQTRGTSTSSIALQWNASGGSGSNEMYYTIYRSSSADSSKITVADITGTEYTDTKNLKAGVYYYYFIKPHYTNAEGELFQGALSSLDGDNTEGFLLSAPTNITCIKSTEGQILSFPPALGNEEERDLYVYHIWASSDNAMYADSGVTITEATNFNGETGRLQVTLSAAVTSSAKYYKIQTEYAGTTSALSAAVSPAPYGATNAVATRAQNIGGSANGNGIYPVKITWNKPANDNPDGYFIYRSDKFDTGYKKITEEPVTDLQYIDDNDTGKPSKVYYYKVLALNSLKQGVNYSNTTYGYGALEPIQYLTEYINTIKYSQSKLTYLNKSSDTDKLNTETIGGDISGTLYYDGKLSGLTANFIMKYTNYADYKVEFTDPATGNPTSLIIFLVNGNTDSSTNTSGNGSMSGTMTAANCMYPGEVYYGNIQLTGGKIKGGTYRVTPSGFGSTDVPYSYGTW